MNKQKIKMKWRFKVRFTIKVNWKIGDNCSDGCTEYPRKIKVYLRVLGKRKKWGYKEGKSGMLNEKQLERMVV